MKKSSDKIISDKVVEFWKKTYPQDVAIFFKQKYDFEEKYHQHEEVALANSCFDYTVNFVNDFCEGETDVIDIQVVPLSIVLTHYRESVIELPNKSNTVKGLQTIIDLIKFDPSTGNEREYSELDDLCKGQIDACYNAQILIYYLRLVSKALVHICNEEGCSYNKETELNIAEYFSK